MIKTFRGRLTVGNVDTIVLHTNNGSTGYKIHKLEVIQKSPGAVDCEGLIKIWKTTPNATDIASTTFDLADNTVLGIAFYSKNSAEAYPVSSTIIFDKEVFNQDIYVTYIDVLTNDDPMNYYIELEQVKLDLSESTVATLKDIRNITAPA